MTRLEMVCENIVVGFVHGGGNDEKHELICSFQQFNVYFFDNS